MRLSKSVSKNATSLYVIESTYIHGKRSTRTVESLGTLEQLSKEHEDPIAWAEEHVRELNAKQRKEREESKSKSEVILKLNAAKQIPRDTRFTFNGGYLFLQKLFYDYELDTACSVCQENTGTKYNLAEIFSSLICSRILNPGSILKSFEFAKRRIEPPTFELHDVYRAASLLAKNSDFLQERLYTVTKEKETRHDRIMYYDCTNYYFETEEEDELRKYSSAGKEHRPNPIVGMGLMMDEDGIPLACSIYPGNQNEKMTLTPLEERIEKDYKHSTFILCTDAGLCSGPMKKFNSGKNKAFITVQPIKQLSVANQEWALSPDGWKMVGGSSTATYSLDDINRIEEEAKANGEHSIYYDKKFYKSKNDVIEIDLDKKGPDGEKLYDHVSQIIYFTYSLKFRDYLRNVRNGQIERAVRKFGEDFEKNSKGKKKSPKYGQNDYRRFIESVNFTDTGELAEHTTYRVKEELIQYEEKYDGFYAVATNLGDPIEVILDINKKRWEIEECFRISKDILDSRPVFVSREDRIRAHFLVCFFALTFFRFLEKKLSTPDRKYTAYEIISQLREMDFYAHSGSGYIPTYTRTDLTDRLHQVFGFRTDYEIIPLKSMKKIVQKSKGI